ncbi:MAG: DUF433 domain-containing protein [Proteobacteria bacterium]|nr:DUF433 domain-containing protein [Pseudomonadota bacterium]
MQSKTQIQISPDVLHGMPTFVGTRVPVQILIDYLCAGDSIEMFLDDFPTVTKAQVTSVLTLIKDKIPTLVA